jgi:hypothetical protein
LGRRLEQVRVRDGRILAITRREHGNAIGVLAYRVDDPEDGWMTFDMIAMASGLRGVGLDAEAVRLVEEDAVERGLAGRFRAVVNREEGLELYFWLRLGYRVAGRNEAASLPGSPHDIIAMVRETGAQ